MLKRFFSDSFIYLLPNLISRGLAFFLVPFYTRVLMPADYGAIDLLTTFGNLVNIVVALEVSQGVARYFSDSEIEKRERYSSTAWVFSLLTYTFFLVISLIFSDVLTYYIVGESKYVTAFKMSLVVIWFNGLFYLIQNQLRWELRSREYSILSILYSIITIAGSVYFTLYERLGLHGMLLGQIIGGAGGTLIGWYWLRKSFTFQLDLSALKDMLIFSAPLVPSGIGVFVFTYFDRLMINSMLGIENVGIYGIGSRFASSVTLALSGFQLALTPLIFKHYREPATPQKLANMFRYFFTFSILLILTLSLFSKELLVLLTTPQYYSAAHLVAFLSPGLVLANMYIFAPGISIAKKTHLFLWVNIGGGIINIVLNYYLIGIFGVVGAALATLMTGFSLFFVHMMISQKLYYVPHDWLRIAASAVFCCSLYYFSVNLTLDFAYTIMTKVLMIATSLIMFVMLGVIRTQEIIFAYKSLRGNTVKYESLLD